MTSWATPIATSMNVATLRIDVFEPEPTPQTPCPEVHPLPSRVPIPMRIPPKNSRDGWTSVVQPNSPVASEYPAAPATIPSVNTTRQSREATNFGC